MMGFKKITGWNKTTILRNLRELLYKIQKEAMYKEKSKHGQSK
jgi:hypothetical protein